MLAATSGAASVMREMCGIAGVIDARDGGRFAEAMADTLRHRGPDAAGAWRDDSAGVGLAFRRLAIIDLTPTGDQPMTSRDGRFVIVFNGEIYNHNELRERLTSDGVRFRGSSDTEVLLEAIAEWGIEPTLRAANGMFALAVWDIADQVLHLARDRFGEKPLYFGRTGGVFVFASELKAIRAHPRFEGRVAGAAVALYLRHGYVPAPLSIYEGISKLSPACRVEVRRGHPGGEVPYWELPTDAPTTTMSAPEAIEALDDLLTESVRLRMISDVPLGALLSGGVDSSTIVALMQKQSSRAVRTFSIGFPTSGYDESEAAAAVAAHLGTEHTALEVTPADALAVVPRLATMYDEPFADSSQIPTFLVSELARRHVTVALTGDGADELFGGYSRYEAGRGPLSLLARLPRPVRRVVGVSIDGLPGLVYRPLAKRFSRPEEKAAKLARVLRSGGDPLTQLTWLWNEPPVQRQFTPPAATWRTTSTLSRSQEMMASDTVGYLPDDILVKVDRASMAVSLEGRMPFLDPHIADFAWSLPMEWRVGRQEGKWIVRRVLERYVPRAIVARPKTGFGVPIGDWLRGPLREWAQALLAPSEIASDRVLDGEPIRRAWEGHLAGEDRAHELWAVLMLRAWSSAPTDPS